MTVRKRLARGSSQKVIGQGHAGESSFSAIHFIMLLFQLPVFQLRVAGFHPAVCAVGPAAQDRKTAGGSPRSFASASAAANPHPRQGRGVILRGKGPAGSLAILSRRSFEKPVDRSNLRNRASGSGEQPPGI